MRALPTAAVLLAAAASGLAAAPSRAGDCAAQRPGASLTGDGAEAVYDCLSEAMKAGYDRGSKRWIPEEHVARYRDWTRASRVPAAPGPHGGRFLVTWVNPAGAEAYLRYASPRGEMPVGTVIAKESFTVGPDGAAEAGPLFLMQKVEPGLSPDTNDWHYMLVAPSGAPLAVEVMSACNACHQGSHGGSDGMAYPVPEARIE